MFEQQNKRNYITFEKLGFHFPSISTLKLNHLVNMINLSFQHSQMIPSNRSKFQKSICHQNEYHTNYNPQGAFDFLYNSLAQSQAQTNRLICINNLRKFNAQSPTLPSNNCAKSKQFESVDQSIENLFHILKKKNVMDELVTNSKKIGQQMAQRSKREIKNLNGKLNDSQKKLESMSNTLKLCLEFLVQILSTARAYQILPKSKFSAAYDKLLEYQQSNLRFPKEMMDFIHKNWDQIYEFQLKQIGERINKEKIEYFKKMDIINQYKKTALLQIQQIKQINVCLLKRMKELQQNLQTQVKLKQNQYKLRIQIEQNASKNSQYLQSMMRITTKIVNSLENIKGKSIFLKDQCSESPLLQKGQLAIQIRIQKLRAVNQMLHFQAFDHSSQKQIFIENNIEEEDSKIDLVY